MEQVPNPCFFFAEKMSRWIQKKLQAAACREVSAANSLSVLIKDSWSTKKRAKVKKKKDKLDAQQLVFKGDRYSEYKWGGGLHVTETKWFLEQNILVACFATSGWLREGSERAAHRVPLLESAWAPLSTGTENSTREKVLARWPPRDNEEPVDGVHTGSEDPLRSPAIFCDPREFQWNPVFVLQDQAAREADGHGGPCVKAGTLANPTPPSSLPSQHTCAGDLLQTSSQRRHMVLTC